MKLNEYFDKIYCINLDRRTDRWEECEKIFSKLNLVVERFSAEDGKLLTLPHGDAYNAEIAGAISHTNVIKDAKEKGYKNILILEDDVEFHPDFEILLDKMFSQVPNDWEMLFFGGNHVQGFTNISENIQRLFGSYAIHAYGIKNDVYDIIIKFMSDKIDMVFNNKETKYTPSVAADYFMAFLHKTLTVYGFKNPHLAWQRTGFSDIQGGIVNYDFLKK
jgi:GR25 family glycosyltransferase involved in LPS biosynthesis